MAHTIAIDACLRSVGGIWNDKVYTALIPKNILDQNLTITHYEMLNIIVALNIWKEEWRNKRIVVTICKTGYTRDSHLAAYARNIWLITSVYDIELCFTHIPGHTNQQADLLSRWEEGSVTHLQRLKKLVPNFQWQTVWESYFEVNTEI